MIFDLWKGQFSLFPVANLTEYCQCWKQSIDFANQWTGLYIIATPYISSFFRKHPVLIFDLWKGQFWPFPPANLTHCCQCWKQSIDFANQWTGLYIIATLGWNILREWQRFRYYILLSIVNLWWKNKDGVRFYPTVVLLGKNICTFPRINNRSFKAKYNSIYYQIKKQSCIYQKNIHYLKVCLSNKKTVLCFSEKHSIFRKYVS